MLKATVPMLIAIIAVFAVIYLSYVFSKYLAVGAGKMSGAKYMRVVDRLVLGQDKMMAIVQIGPAYYLAGVTEQSVQILKELDAEDLIEMTGTQERFTDALTGNFKDTLGKYMGKKENK